MTLAAQQLSSQETVVNVASLEGGVSFKPGMCLRDIERHVILETLKQQNFNRTRAARVLGIGIRTLQRKLKEYRAEGLSVGSLN